MMALAIEREFMADKSRPGPDSNVAMMAHRGGAVSQPERF